MSDTVMDYSCSRAEISTKDNILMVNLMVLEDIYGLMEVFTKDNFRWGCGQDLVNGFLL